MIVFHKSLKRSQDIARSLKRFFELNFKTMDGIIETFNNNIGQGYILKLFHSYNDNTDLAIWFYESLKDKNIQVAYSTLSNVDKHNNWINPELVNFKEYPIKKDIKISVIKNIFNNINNYYGLNEQIEMPKKLTI